MQQTGRRRALGIATGALLLGGAAGCGSAEEKQPDKDVTVTWAGTEGHPSCLYDPEGHTVYATLKIVGVAPEPDTLRITVTAYADENTSEPVGSITSEQDVDGIVGVPLILTIDVEAPPHVDEDGEAACGIDVT